MKAEYDFSKARRAKDIPHLVKLQAKENNKKRISIMLDADVIEAFRARGDASGRGYQTLINEALRAAIDPEAAPVTVGALRSLLKDRLALAV